MTILPTPRQLTDKSFLQLGASSTAYVRPVIHEGQPAYGVFGANGIPLATAKDRLAAKAICFEHELLAFDVH